MSYPDVTVEIAFGIDPYVVPAPGDWVDVTADFFGASIKHGKQSALDEYQPANATIELWNLERQYEANYAAGPHYPDIVGDTWIRMRTVYSAVTYYLFTGLIDIDGWQAEWVRPQKVTVQATGYTRALGVKALVDPWKQATLNAEPYACYPMFESGGIAYDISGGNRHGLYQGAAQLGQHDPVDDGRASGLLSDSEHLGYFEADYGWSGTGDFTVTLWFNSLSGIVQKFPLMFGLDRLLGKRAQLNVIPVTTGTYRLNFVIYETFSLFPTNLFNAGEWLWINIIRHGTTVDLYVNRFLIATGTSSATIGNGSMQVGRTIYDDPSGYLTAWPTLFDYEVSTADLDAMWAARDSWENDTAGPRLTKIFEQIGIDPAMGDFDTGTSLLAPAAIDGSSALTHARDVEKAELGGLYELGSGVIRFRERHAFHFAPYTENQVTIGRGASELPYEQIFPEQSVVYNEAVASREGGQTFVARDTSGRFLNRALSETGLLLQSDNEVADRVSWRVATLKDQVFFPAGVTLNPHADDALWPQVLGRFLEDRVTIKRTNAVGTVVTFVCRILGITHDIGTGQKWKTTWRLGPIQDGPTLWLIGVAGKSEIGVNTFVNY